MERVLRYIEDVRTRPHRERKRAVHAWAAGITAVIAATWLGLSLATGSFLIADNGASAPSADTGSQRAPAVAGAAAALPADTAGPAKIQIIDTTTPAPKAPEPTTIPF